jgi:hypothetical protein
MPRYAEPIIMVAFLVLSSECGCAAVRQCGGHVASDVVSAKTEFDAKRQAISQWVERAVRGGRASATWRLAADRLLKCARNSDHFECVAIGRPCIIVQNPKAPDSMPGDEENI